MLRLMQILHSPGRQCYNVALNRLKKPVFDPGVTHESSGNCDSNNAEVQYPCWNKRMGNVGLGGWRRSL